MCLKPPGEVGSANEVSQMCTQLRVAVAMPAVAGCLLERVIHTLGLAVGPRVARLGQATLDLMANTDVLGDMRAEQLAALDCLVACKRRRLRRLPGVVKCSPLSARRQLFRCSCFGRSSLRIAGYRRRLASE